MVDIIAWEFGVVSVLTLVVSLSGTGLGVWGVLASLRELSRVGEGVAHMRRWSDRLLNGSHRRIAIVHVVSEITDCLIQLICVGLAVQSMTLNVRSHIMSDELLGLLLWRRIGILMISIVLSLSTLWIRLEWQAILRRIDDTYQEHRA